LRALAAARVRLRPLPVHRQAAPVADPAIRADLAEAFYRVRPVAAQATLDLELRVDVVAELRDLFVRQVLDLRVRVEPELRSDLARGRLADPVDVREPVLEPLLVRKVDSGDACHWRSSPAFACAEGWCR